RHPEPIVPARRGRARRSGHRPQLARGAHPGRCGELVALLFQGLSLGHVVSVDSPKSTTVCSPRGSTEKAEGARMRKTLAALTVLAVWAGLSFWSTASAARASDYFTRFRV